MVWLAPKSWVGIGFVALAAPALVHCGTVRSYEDQSAGASSEAGAAGSPAAGGDGGAGAGLGGSDSSSADAGGQSEGGSSGEGGAAGLGGSAAASGDGGSPELGSAGAGGDCAGVVAAYPLANAEHVDVCTPISHLTNPPSSGNHYPTWADFGAYDFPLPRGYWVHNLEHGAVVVTYNCPGGCASEVKRAKAWLAQLTPDATCPAGAPRVLLVPDPLLDVRWAASSWGYALRADCFDAQEFSNFVALHTGNAPEGSLCTPGVDLRAPGAETCGAN